MKKSKQNFNTSDLLRACNLKITKARIAILEILISQKKPLTVEDIIGLIKSDVNTTTIYRSLEQMAQKGIISKTNFLDGKIYYEHQSSHHHHIMCTHCGTKEGIDLCVKDSLPNVIAGSKKFKSINSHILELFSICTDCVSKK